MARPKKEISASNQTSVRNADRKLWYKDVKEACSNGENVGIYHFLLLFTGPMCIPSSLNYQKVEDREAGNHRDNRSEENILAEQMRFLRKILEKTKQMPKPDENLNLKGRFKELALGAKEEMDRFRDQEYVTKKENYKPERFLSLFEKESAQAVKDVVEYYIVVLKWLFESKQQERDVCLEKMEDVLRWNSLNPQVPPFEDPFQKFAWLLLACLLLKAGQTVGDSQQANILLQTEVQCNAPPTVKLATESFEKLCLLALRKENLSEGDVSFVYGEVSNLLDAGHPCHGRMCEIVEHLGVELKRMSDVLHSSLDEDLDQDDIGTRMQKLVNMRKDCREWLSKKAQHASSTEKCQPEH